MINVMFTILIMLVNVSAVLNVLLILKVFFDYLDGNINHVLFTPFWLIIMILINVVVIYAVIHRKKAGYYKQVVGQQQEQFQAEYDFFKDYKDNNVDLIKFRHDFNNHMLVVKGLYEKGQYTRANEYIDKLVDATGGLKKTYVTGHEIFDMILKSKAEILGKNNIEFMVEGNLTGLDFIADVDACILFSNLLDNAIEANLNWDASSTTGESKRSIKLIAKTVNKMIYIQLDNTYREGLDNKPTKNNGDVHGIDLQNVREIVEKYNGEQKVDKDNEVYSVKLMFQQNN